MFSFENLLKQYSIETIKIIAAESRASYATARSENYARRLLLMFANLLQSFVSRIKSI